MATTPYWLDGIAPVRRAAAVGEQPEVIVIGGGVTGCSCALRLAEAGVRVRVHDAGRIGGGASGRNGGFALRGAASAYDVLVARIGREQARSLMHLTERGLDQLEELAGDAFERVGSVRLAGDDTELRALEAEHAALEADGFAAARIDRLEPPLDRLYRGGLLHPSDGTIHPGRWLARLAGRAVDAGAELVPESAIDVEVARRKADAVVVATDGSTARLLPELASVVMPTRGQMLATAPLPELGYGRPHYARAGWDYWRQLPDGRLVLGGRRDTSLEAELTGRDETTSAVQAQLDALAAELTGMRPAVDYRWSGAWGATPDGLPLAGRLQGRDGVWVAGGYSGHGNVLGLVCGSLVADAILGRPAPELSLLDPARFGLDE